ncbi:hypothetical protein SASPL_115001 [Salvia splendens]|uniref:Dirigent protein n=1 Tax=Salvia splendens TaxID=180675 RepID=A0A4D8Z1I3_SALSN|nr:dirigent protein 22-like [Salvia splendens]XP_042059115.1 dirigent protein 22-like [Salvia splendens]KAG6424582.1 hypothetical protein SASPL_115000 [Salvia splendens]KAG6424583.1 hypothetical protein SASPL_115001 [Salvia splendens]
MDVKEETWFKAAVMTHPEEKSAVLHFYVQDFRAGSGPGATVYVVAESSISATSPTDFGEIHVTDDLITTRPEVNSEVIGKVQGTTISADFLVSGETMYLNFYFTAGEYAGSTLTMLGRNEIMNEEREMPIVGGTGFFRLARGYALSRTYSYDVERRYAVMEYTLYVSYVGKFDVELKRSPAT